MKSSNNLQERLVLAGKVARPHGLKGGFVVLTDTGKESSLGYVTEIFIGKDTTTAVGHSSLRRDWMPSGWVLAVREIRSPEGAKKLVGMNVYVNRKALSPIPSSTYYLADLQGKAFIDSKTRAHLGTLVRVERAEHPLGHDWWVGSSTDGKEFFVPTAPHYVEKVDGDSIFLKNAQDIVKG